MDAPRIILDADGVFLSERPYWSAALHTALTLNGVVPPEAHDWQELCDVAFLDLGLQRITKRRGCNSNWDLAVVLVTALRSRALRQEVWAGLDRRDWRGAVHHILAASEDLLRGNVSEAPVHKTPSFDPLQVFGVDRHGAEYEHVRLACQRALMSTADQSGSADGTCADRATIVTALSRLRDDGYELAVCTGRPRSELLTPMERNGLADFFSSDNLITADEVAASERTLSLRPLSKPHWFPAVLAAQGRSRAEAAVLNGGVETDTTGRVIYAGDGVADFRSVEGACSIGQSIEYIHVRSGVTQEAEERVISAAPCTLAIVPGLSAVPDLLDTTRARMVS